MSCFKAVDTAGNDTDSWILYCAASTDSGTTRKPKGPSKSPPTLRATSYCIYKSTLYLRGSVKRHFYYHYYHHGMKWAFGAGIGVRLPRQVGPAKVHPSSWSQWRSGWRAVSAATSLCKATIPMMNDCHSICGHVFLRGFMSGGWEL